MHPRSNCSFCSSVRIPVPHFSSNSALGMSMRLSFLTRRQNHSECGRGDGALGGNGFPSGHPYPGQACIPKGSVRLVGESHTYSTRLSPATYPTGSRLTNLPRLACSIGAGSSASRLRHSAVHRYRYACSRSSRQSCALVSETSVRWEAPTPNGSVCSQMGRLLGRDLFNRYPGAVSGKQRAISRILATGRGGGMRAGRPRYHWPYGPDRTQPLEHNPVGAGMDASAIRPSARIPAHQSAHQVSANSKPSPDWCSGNCG